MKNYSISNASEVYVSLTPDDFEQGDRIYWISERVNLHFGTITDCNAQKITILPDEARLHFAIDLTSGKEFDEIFAGYGKPLDLLQVQRNSVISYLPKPTGKRIYVRVIEHLPGKHIKGFYINEKLTPFEAVQSDHISIERQLAFWELED